MVSSFLEKLPKIRSTRFSHTHFICLLQLYPQTTIFLLKDTDFMLNVEAIRKQETESDHGSSQCRANGQSPCSLA